MGSKGRRGAIALLIFIMIIAPVHAVQIRWSWHGDFDQVTRFRYRITAPEKTEWKYLGKKAREVITEGVAGVENRVELQSTLDDSTWSDSISMYYTPLGEENASPKKASEKPAGNRWGMRMSASPYTQGLIDFYNGHDIEGAKYLTKTKYGASANIEAFYDVGRYFSFSLGGGYTFAEKPETVIPEAHAIHYARMHAGADGYFISTEKMKTGLGLTMGGAFEINAGRWNIAPVFGTRLSFEWNISDSISFGAVISGSLSYHGHEDPLMRSFTWMVDPVALTAACRF